MAHDGMEALTRELASLREEVADLRHAIADIQERLRRLEIKEELLESPGAAGDEPVRLG
jgi:predicted  nucleic acid-binding Zn-ribbon protein